MSTADRARMEAYIAVMLAMRVKTLEIAMQQLNDTRLYEIRSSISPDGQTLHLRLVQPVLIEGEAC